MKYDIVIIGAGGVGLATALKIKEQRPELNVRVVEKEDRVSPHQTGNNSGVIHSGIYYRPGSLRAKNCVDGYNELIRFCQTVNVKYDLCGKIIVATDKSELPYLDNIYNRGLENGLSRIKKIDKAEIKTLEPYCNGIAGIYVPYTGIISFKEVCVQIDRIFQEMYRGELSLNTKVVDIILKDKLTEVVTNKETIQTDLVINCAGLYSDKIAALNTKNLNVRIIPFRGEYYKLKKDKEHLVKSLIYPVPDPAFPFLGVHFTKLIEGGIEAGPNAVFAFKREGYKKFDFDFSETMDSVKWPGFQKIMKKYWRKGFMEFYRSFNKHAFTKALQKLVPVITENDLETGGAGVRAMACDRNGELIDDFIFVEENKIINVLNAPSPAATASFAIGKTIAAKALEHF